MLYRLRINIAVPAEQNSKRSDRAHACLGCFPENKPHWQIKTSVEKAHVVCREMVLLLQGAEQQCSEDTTQNWSKASLMNATNIICLVSKKTSGDECFKERSTLCVQCAYAHVSTSSSQWESRWSKPLSMKTRALAYECLCTNTIYVQEQAMVIHTRYFLGVHTSSEQIRAKHKTRPEGRLDTNSLCLCIHCVSFSKMSDTIARNE